VNNKKKPKSPYFLYSSVYFACGKVGKNQTEKPKKKEKQPKKNESKSKIPNNNN